MSAPAWMRMAVDRWGAEIARRRAGRDLIGLMTGLRKYESRQLAHLARSADWDLTAMRQGLETWESERKRGAAASPPAAPAPVAEDWEIAPGAERPAKESIQTDEDGDRLAVSAEGQGLVRNLDDLAREAGIDLAVWAADDFKVRTWATPMRRRRAGVDGKRADDEVCVVRSWYVAAAFRRRLDTLTAATDWTPRPRVAPIRSAAVPVAVLLPDMQIGYRWGPRHRQLLPLHDWAAIDAALRFVRVVQPQVVQNLGDGLDFAAFSTKFAVPLELRDTARPSLLTAHAILRRQRDAAPSAEIDYQGGNHEARSETALIGTEYDGLTTAGAPDGPPVLSFAHLLGLDALDVTWRRYGEHRWLFDRVLVHHGDVVRAKGGGTVAAVIRDAHHSVVFGHIHRLELASRTIHGPAGRRVITAATPGCLCRTDGAVPGVSQRPDWQQGVGLVWWDETRQQEHIELIPIHDGVLVWRGERIEGEGAELAAEVGAAIGWPQVAAGAEAA
jgi:hypothetical protein